MLDRFKKLYLPFFFTSCGLVVGYIYLKWVVVDQFQLIQPKEELVNFWIPFFLGTAVAYWVMAPRFKVFNFSQRKRDIVGYGIWGFMVAPLLLGISYFNSLDAGLTTVEHPSQISKSPLSTYYNIQSAQVLKNNYGFYMTMEEMGRYGTQAKVTCYFVSPLIDDNSSYNVDSQLVETWIGYGFSRSFSTNDTRDSKKMNEYVQETFKSFKAHQFQTTFLHRLDNSDKKDAYLNAILDSKLPFDKENIFLFEEKKGGLMDQKASPSWLIGTLLVGNLFWLMISLLGRLDLSEYRVINSAYAKKMSKSSRLEVLGIFIPSDDYWLTPILIDINLMIFLVMVISGVSVISPQAIDLIKWGGNLGQLSLHGQSWRLVTSMFVHVGILHLVNNLVVLGLIGYFLEFDLGRAKLFGLYMISGIVGSVASAYLHDTTVSVGASGAIFGLLGFVIMPFLVSRNFAFLILVLAYLGFNLLIGINSISDNSAHLGGLVVGFLFGLISIGIKYSSKSESL